MERKIICKDLAAVQAEVLVCAAPSPERESLLAAADFERMTDAANRHGSCPPLDAYWTPGFDLYARQVLHVNLPPQCTEAELRTAYRRAMQLLREKNVRSAAIALLGREQVGLDAACRIAREETAPPEEEKPALIYLTVDREAFRKMK